MSAKSITFKRVPADKVVDVYVRGRLACGIYRDIWGRKGYTIIVTADRRTGQAAKIENLTFDKLGVAKRFVTVWLESGDPRLAVHRTLCPLPEYFGR